MAHPQPLGTADHRYACTVAFPVACILLPLCLAPFASAQDPAWEDRPLLIADGPTLPPPPADDAARVMAFRDGREMNEFLERSVPYGFSGAVLAFRGQDMLLRAGFGLRDRTGHNAMPADARFDVGSIAKSFTAAAVLRLAEQGKLDLDAPVRRVLDYVPESLDAVTPRLLLRHASGMSSSPDFSALPGFEDARPVVLAAMASVEPGLAGMSFAYSNAGYSVLAAIVEEAAAMPFQNGMRELVFDPAGLTRTGLVGEVMSAGPLALGYSDRPRRRPATDGIFADESEFQWGHRGATGVVTTVTDLYRWCRALQSPAVLAPSSREAMFTQGQGDYALGWLVRSRPAADLKRLVYEHDGSTIGFQSSLSFWPDEPAVLAILSNTTNGSAPLIKPKLEQIMWGGVVRLPPKTADPPVPNEHLRTFEGRYRIGAGVLVIAHNEDLDRLTVHAEGQDAVDALVKLDDESRAQLDRWHEIALEALTAFKTRDPIPALAHTHEQVPERAAENWIMRWGSVDGGAQLDRVEILGTAPGDLGPLTYARLTYAEGRSPEIVRVLWVDDQIAGLSRAPLGGPGAMQLVAESPEFLAGFDARTWDTTRFFLAPDGSMVVSGPAGDHRATRP